MGEEKTACLSEHQPDHVNSEKEQNQHFLLPTRHKSCEFLIAGRYG
jgi:hypothetical protein